MNSKLFVNLPVKDINSTINFFSALGFNFESKYTDENAACMIVSDTIFVMMLTEAFFSSFVNKKIADAFNSVQSILAIELTNRDDVDSFIDKVISAGGKESMPAIDHGFMYSRSFEDLNGHQWEVFWMRSE